MAGLLGLVCMGVSLVLANRVRMGVVGYKKEFIGFGMNRQPFNRSGFNRTTQSTSINGTLNQKFSIYRVNSNVKN